ncbi:MAG TPA: dethiobiotin synthase [Rhodanobacteraceae bacterium]|nr:dethiobiotin synthase [Rhodanobacteraceae bacterium]
MSARGVFIAGTDTGIGKTFVACALLHAVRAQNRRASGMKPVASGCESTAHGLRNEDALALIAASDPAPNYTSCNPFAFVEPISPHLAAAAMGAEVRMTPIATAYARLAEQADAVVVEGVGGWLAPLSSSLPASALAQSLQLPVILVVGLKLGCLNHALLSARAITADGCRLLGWVGNHIDPSMACVEQNLDTLRQCLPAPCLGVVNHNATPAAAAQALAPAANQLFAAP